MEPHGLSRWRYGCSRITPVSPRRRPGGDTVAPGVFPVYHGIWQPSRLLPVSPGCFKHFKTTGDMSRFNTVQHGSFRISKVVHGAATVDNATVKDTMVEKTLYEWNGFIVTDNQIQCQMVTDASSIGCSAWPSGENAQGFWNCRLSNKHSNYQEVLMGLKSFQWLLKGRTVQVLSDNVTIVAF